MIYLETGSKWLASCCLVSALLASTSVLARDDATLGDVCFEQTQRLKNGVAPAKLNTRACNAALSRARSNAYYQSAMLHNRALIERAKGQVSKARQSLEAAVALLEEPGAQHLALAQLAAKQGDRQRAAQLYQMLIESDTRNPLVSDNKSLFQRNLNALAEESDLAKGY